MLPAKYLETMAKRRHTVLFFAHGEEAKATIVVCHNRRAQIALLSRYGRLKFLLQCVDFWAPYKIGRIYVETAPYGVVLCALKRGGRDPFVETQSLQQ